MLWILTRAMNLALTAAALAAGIIVSGGLSRSTWANLATSDLDLGALNALAETNSLADSAKVIWSSFQPFTDKISGYLQNVKEEEGQQVAGVLNRHIQGMQDAVYAGDFVGLVMPIALVFAAFLALRFFFRILLRKSRKGRTGRSDFQVV